MEQDAKRMLLEYNRETKRLDDLYRCAAKQCGISECAFWILYTLRAEERQFTQAEICEFLIEPKQTVHSALKKLEEEGIIHRENNPRDKRNKLVKLTVPKGKAYADALMREMEQAEVDAFLSLTPAQQTAITSGLEAFANAIEQAFGKTMQKKMGLVRRCIEDYNMIEAGDRVAVGANAMRRVFSFHTAQGRFPGALHPLCFSSFCLHFPFPAFAFSRAVVKFYCKLHPLSFIRFLPFAH